MSLNLNMLGGDEMDKCKEKELKDLKLRQQLWESSPELRDLTVKLRAAYIAKGVAAQITEKKAQAKQEKIKQQRFADLMEERTMICKGQEIQKRQEAHEKMLQYREELHDQIMQLHEREAKYQKFLKEKALLDQIARAIREEEQREEEMEMEQIKRLKCDIDEFCQMQEASNLMEKQALFEEDRRIKSYQAKCEQEEKKKIEELKRKEDIKKQLEERTEAAYLSHHIPINEKRERLEVLHDLGAEELSEQDLRRVKEELESALRKRKQLNSSYRQQLEDKRKQLLEEEAQEEIYKQQMLAQFAEHARLEQLTAEKRRLKNLDHRKQVQQLVEKKQKQRADEWEQLQAEEKRMQAEKKHRAQIIEEERIRILKKHATNLLGYLPRAVLREDDLTHLEPGFIEQFNKLKTNLNN